MRTLLNVFADTWQPDLKFCIVKFFFLLLVTFVNKSWPQMEGNVPFMVILVVSIIQIIKPHKHAPSHKQVVFIRLTQAIYN